MQQRDPTMCGQQRPHRGSGGGGSSSMKPGGFDVGQKISLAGVFVSFIGSITVPFVITKYFDNEKNLLSEEIEELKAWRQEALGEFRGLEEKFAAQEDELRDLKAANSRALVGVELQGVDRVRLQRGSGEFTEWQAFPGNLESRLSRVEEESIVTGMDFDERTGELSLRQGGMRGEGKTVRTSTKLHQAFTEVSITGTELALTRLDGISRVSEQVSLVFNNSGELLPTYTKSQIDDKLTRKLDATQLYVELGKKADLVDIYPKNDLDLLLAGKSAVDQVYTKAELDGFLSSKPDSDGLYTKSELDTLLAGKPSFEAVYTKTEVDGLLLNAAQQSDSSFGEYAKKSEVDTALGKKADKADTYSKKEVYSKPEMEKLLQKYCKGEGQGGGGDCGGKQPVLSPSSSDPAQGKKVCTNMGPNTMELSGTELRWVLSTDLATCEKHCLSEKACIGFTHHTSYEGGSCWLWSKYKGFGQTAEKEKSFSKCE